MSDCVLCGQPIDYCQGHGGDWEEVVVALETMMPEYVDLCMKLVKEGKGVWVWDPNVNGVAGLVRPMSTTAWCVVYVESQDAEFSMEFEELVFG